METHEARWAGDSISQHAPRQALTAATPGLAPALARRRLLGRVEAVVTVATAGTEEGMSEEEQGSGTTTGCGLPR